MLRWSSIEEQWLSTSTGNHHCFLGQSSFICKIGSNQRSIAEHGPQERHPNRSLQ
jgi:hypothetical protein